jgi:hypothetical protein
MRVCADLGCIQESKQLPRRLLDGNTTVRWQESYALSPVTFELPESGSRHEEMACPVCGQELKLKVVSIASLHLGFTLAFWLITIVAFGLSSLLYFGAGATDETMAFIGLIFYGISGVLLLGTLAFMFVQPDYLAGIADALQITGDYAREHDDSEGFSGRKGHKLFKVRPAK